ncbi:MAG TPA: extracellular solute-binding protein [Thermomicrobiales bacterium]|nr:extracellular solute-binding protein [Thermomicrobiales bacterium]
MRSGWARAALIALLMALVALPQLGRAAQDEPVELLIWDQAPDNPAVSEVIDSVYAGFTEQNPNVTIRRETIQNEQLRQTVRTALASGTGPDIIFYDAGPGYMGVLADAGLITPLQPFAEEFGWDERIAQSARNGASYEGELYGLPLQVDLIGVYVNTTLMTEAGLETPTTFEEILTFCQSATEAGYLPFAFANQEGWQAFHQIAMTGNNMIGPEAMGRLLLENEGRWDSPEMVRAIEAFFVDMRDAGCYSEDANGINYDDGNALFFGGQALLHSTGNWLISDITANMPDYELEFVPFPPIEGGAGSFFDTGVGSAYMISASSPNQEEAAQFLDYLFSPEVVQRWVAEANYVVPAEFDIEAVEATPLFRSVLETLAASIAGEEQLGYNIDVLAPPAFNDVMLNGFQAVLAGDRTAEEQAAAMQAAWDEGMAADAGTPAP